MLIERDFMMNLKLERIMKKKRIMMVNMSGGTLYQEEKI
jgi:hypothetical protein